MRKIFLLIAISLMILSCSDESASNQTITGEIVGKWKLVYRHPQAFASHIFDESAKNIVYDFTSNGILVVNGDKTGPHANGQYSYSFSEETITVGEQNYESFAVRIGEQKWLCYFSDDEMNLREPDGDYGSLTFIKK